MKLCSGVPACRFVQLPAPVLPDSAAGSGTCTGAVSLPGAEEPIHWLVRLLCLFILGKSFKVGHAQG